MKVKVAELEGASLDAAVAKCDPESARDATRDDHFQDRREWKPSTNWNQGGKIIERERIAIYSPGDVFGSTYWIAGSDMEVEAGRYYSEETGSDSPTIALKNSAMGSSPLEAAMRAYVCSKFGAEVEL